MKKEKILITGGSGFVGTNLIDKLPKDIFEIFSIDIEKPKINFDGVKYEDMDIRSKHIGDFIKDIDPKIILHLAAQSSVSVSSKDPVLDNDVNLNGSLNLFLNSTKSNVKQFISFSTGGAIYGEECLPDNKNKIFGYAGEKFAHVTYEDMIKTIDELL